MTQKRILWTFFLEVIHILHIPKYFLSSRYINYFCKNMTRLRSSIVCHIRSNQLLFYQLLIRRIAHLSKREFRREFHGTYVQDHSREKSSLSSCCRVCHFALYKSLLLPWSTDRGERITSFCYVRCEMDFITFRSVKAAKYGNGLRRCR